MAISVMDNDPDYILDLTGIAAEESAGPPTRELEISASRARNRKYISVLFECCGVYQHIYRNRRGTAYEGRCPRCLRPVRILIGPSGTDSRIFKAR